MERRSRGRPRRLPEDAAAPQLRGSPIGKRTAVSTTVPAGPAVRTRASPSLIKVESAPPPTQEIGTRTRRSSRPRSANAQPISTLTNTKKKQPSPIKEVKESPSPRKGSNLPTTLTTNTSTRAPNKSFLTSSVNSSYSTTSTTTERIEIRSDGEIDEESIRKRLAEKLRRSLSKTASIIAGSDRSHSLTNTGSRYSRSVSRSVYDDDKSSKDSSSDEDDAQESRFRSFNTVRKSLSPQGKICRQLQAPREFGGWFGTTLLMLLVPVLVYYLIWSCAGVRNACAFKRMNLTAVFDWTYISQQVFKPLIMGAYGAFMLAVFVLVALIPGRQVHVTRDSYNFNALGVAIILLAAGGIAEYLKYPVVSFVLRHYLRFCIYGCITAFIAALWSYWRINTNKSEAPYHVLSNDYGRTGIFTVDYALGRQINPKCFGCIDWKQYFYRLSLLTTLIYAFCYIYQTLQWPTWPVDSEEGYIYVARYFWRKVTYDAGTLLTASMLLCYILDSIVFEHHLSSSFELQHEGYGCLLLLRYATTPYLLSSVSKYFYEQRVPISCRLAPYAAGALLLLGLAIKRYSCAYKYKYRQNPHSPLFAGVETINTYQSTRLLLSGLWGRLRQPNYLGDIIALIALGAPLGLHIAYPPMLSLLILIVLLLHRVTRNNARNQMRYHSSWHCYCARVRKCILPKVY